jgi:hypothetical protein
MRFFKFKVVWPNKSIWVSNKHPKIFSILVSNLPRYSNFLCLPCILSIRIDLFCVFSVYDQIHSTHSVNCLLWLSCPTVLPGLSCPICHVPLFLSPAVLPPLSLLFCHFLIVLSYLFCPTYPALGVLSWNSYTDCQPGCPGLSLHVKN